MPLDLSSQIDYYDKMYADETFANRRQLSRCIAILAALRQLDLVDPRICDLGSGSGWLTGILGSFGPTVGVELSSVAVEKAAARHLNVKFICADISGWDYPRGAFDVVVSQEVLEHMEDQSRYLSIAHGLLRAGGHLILTTPNARTVYAEPAQARSNQPLENVLTRRELSSLLGRYFNVVTMRSMILGYGSIGLHQIVNSRKLQKMLKIIGLDTLWRAAACRADFGLHLIVVAQKRQQ